MTLKPTFITVNQDVAGSFVVFWGILFNDGDDNTC